MCGRYTLKTRAQQLAKRYRVEFDPGLAAHLTARYNIPPGTGVLTIRDDRDAGVRKADLFHWGLVPAWAKDVKIGYKLSNARSETAASKPSFRHAMRYRRCVLPADGFFEWQREGGHKQPFYFHAADDRPLSLAGLWEHWQSPDGSEILSVSVLTTRANALMAPIHDRMPVFIPDEALDRWLAPGLTKAEDVADLLRPPPEDLLACHPVSTAVNAVRHDGPELLLPTDASAPRPEPTQGELF
ncbi:MAG: SOS response-associated peptidase [Opitutales bacterium]